MTHQLSRTINFLHCTCAVAMTIFTRLKSSLWPAHSSSAKDHLVTACGLAASSLSQPCLSVVHRRENMKVSREIVRLRAKSCVSRPDRESWEVCYRVKFRECPGCSGTVGAYDIWWWTNVHGWHIILTTLGWLAWHHSMLKLEMVIMHTNSQRLPHPTPPPPTTLCKRHFVILYSE